MALHGEVKVNGIVLLRWKAVRQEYQILQDGNNYHCTVESYPVGEVVEFDIKHHYGDGAAALASTVLRKYTYPREEVSV